MANPSLLEYVKKCQSQGLSQEAIAQSLAANGWNEAAIKEALAIAAMPEAPMGPDFVPAKPQPQGTSVQRTRKPELYSIYSVLLAFVLFFGLLILANKAVSDVGRHFGTDITARLIAQAMLILPFLIAAFALHFSLIEKGEKYRILSQPFYLVSGWLLIRLLFKVSEYILNTQATYGVYIVLVLIVAVLTGVIIFVQKFIRHKE